MITIEQFIENHQDAEFLLDWKAPFLTLQFNRPQQKNALNKKLLHEMMEVLSFIEARNEIRALILTGGPNIFCAGADIKEMASIRQQGLQGLIDNNELYGKMLHRLHLCKVPTIALVDGPALGGGMGLVCACDFVLSTHQGVFGMPEPKIGVIAGQIMPYIIRKLGLVKAQEMSLQGLKLKATSAKDWGFINEVFADGPAMITGLQAYLDNILYCAPNALAETKNLINATTQVAAEDIHHLAQQVAQASFSPEGIEGGMAFLQKRKPQWCSTPEPILEGA